MTIFINKSIIQLKMIISFVFLLLYFGLGSANIASFIFDYFISKNITSVVGFSCSTSKDDILLVKKFNEIGIATTISKANSPNRVNRLAYTTYRTLGVFFDLRCYDLNTIISTFSEAAEYGMYDDLHSWLVIGSDTNITEIMDDKAFGYSTNFVFAIPSMNSTGFELYDVYNLWKEHGTELNVTFIGSWDGPGKINIVNTTRFLRRANLRGVIMRASFYEFTDTTNANASLEQNLQDTSKITRDSISKFGFVILSHLSDLLNFKLECKIASKWQAGDRVGPTVQSILRKECDITGTPALLTPRRLDVLKYTYQLMPYRTCFIFRSPQPNLIEADEILGPLDNIVWFWTFVISVLCICTFAIVLRFEGQNESTFLRYSNSTLAYIGAICQQGTELEMHWISTRFVYFFITLFSFLLYNYYSAVIVSIRLNEPIFKINDSLAELAKTDLKLFSEWMEFFEHYIKRKDWETEFLYNRRWKHIPKDQQFMEPEQALLLVKKGGYAYHVHPDVAYPHIARKFNEREICELTEVHMQRPVYINFGVSYNSTIVEMLRVGLTKISESGLRQRQVIRWKSQKPECDKDGLSASSITIYQFAPHLFVLTFGIGLSFVALTVEILKNRNIKTI